MKILIATGIYPPDIGGPATWVYNFAREFTERGQQVVVVTYSDPSTHSTGSTGSPQASSGQADPGQGSIWPVYRILRSSPKGIRHFNYFWQVWGLAKDFDVILLSDTVSAGFPVRLVSFLSGRPYVLKIGGDYVWEQAFQRWGVKDLLDGFLKKEYGFKIEFLRSLQSWVVRGAKKVLAPSQYLATVAKEWGVPSDKISVIYNSVTPPKVLVSKLEARVKLGISPDQIVLFSFGRNVPWKGLEMLKEIMPEILKHFPKVKLVASEVSREKRDLWFAACDLFLLNTGYEGFSHQILEAMSSGLPIITTNAGGNSEIVENGVNALVAEYNNRRAWVDAIIRLLKDITLQQKLGQGAKNTAQKFLDIDVAGETLKILAKIK